MSKYGGSSTTNKHNILTVLKNSEYQYTSAYVHP